MASKNTNQSIGWTLVFSKITVQNRRSFKRQFIQRLLSLIGSLQYP
jgi:hypothetical protein